MRGVLITAAIALLVIAGVLVSLTVFLNGQGLRERVETALGRALGRTVRINSLQFSVATGSAVAHGLRIADDPRFGGEAFVQAENVRLGLALWPLLSRREVQIGSVNLEHPQIRLLRDAAGAWNYLSIGNRSTPVAVGAQSRTPAALAISRVTVTNGEVLVRVIQADGMPQNRLYDGVEVQVSGFDMNRAFPFRVAMRLPAGGAVQATGTAGPWDRDAVTSTPIAARISVTDLDLAAAGLVKATGPVKGVLQRVAVDLVWTSRGLHVTNLTADSAALHIGVAGPRSSGPSRASVWSELLQRLQVDSATVHAGVITFDRRDGSQLAALATDVNVSRWSPGSPAAFTVVSTIAGGSVHAAGTVVHTAGLPRLLTDSQLKLRHVDLAKGLLPHGSPVRGTVDADVHLVSGGEGGWIADGSAGVQRLVVARNGRPAPGPVLANFRVQGARGVDGGSVATIQGGTLLFGGASVRIAGVYRPGAPVTSLDLRVEGQAMPIDGMESFLPAFAVQLPEGSRLSGGTLSVSVAVQGTPADLHVDGPVHAENTHLNGFDLGGKLASLARWTGGRLGSSSGSGTAIRSIGFQLHTGGGQVVTDALIADVAGIGKISGSGTVGEGATLHYNLLLRLEELTAGAGGGANLARGIVSGLPPAWAQKALGVVTALANGAMRNGVPLLVGGTAKHPVVTPNLGALLPADKPHPSPAQSPWPLPQNAWPGARK